jgi:hypothetical protein
LRKSENEIHWFVSPGSILGGVVEIIFDIIGNEKYFLPQMGFIHAFDARAGKKNLSRCAFDLLLAHKKIHSITDSVSAQSILLLKNYVQHFGGVCIHF